jgi:MFS family permease
VHDFVWLSIGLGGIGLFGSVYHPVGIPWVMRTAERQGTALGINGVFGSAGNACAGLVVGGLIALVDWRAAFIVPGAISVFFGVALLVDWRRGAVGDRPMPATSGKAPGKGAMIKVFFILMVTMFFAGVIFASVFRASRRPDVDFGWNVAGIIAGGLSEQLSLVIGFNNLVLLAIAYYVLSRLLAPRALQAAA